MEAMIVTQKFHQLEKLDEKMKKLWLDMQNIIWNL